MASSKVDALFDALNKMSVLELATLLGYIEDKWGVTASRTAPAQTVETAPAVTMPDVVSVFLVEAGSTRIQVVKAVRDLLGLGLKEANDLTKSSGEIASGLSNAAATELKTALEKAGAVAEIR